jgi:hypothetical protein
MVDIARYAFRLSAWNELAGVDDSFILLYYVKNDGTSDIEIASASSHPLGHSLSLQRTGNPHRAPSSAASPPARSRPQTPS